MSWPRRRSAGALTLDEYPPQLAVAVVVHDPPARLGRPGTHRKIVLRHAAANFKKCALGEARVGGPHPLQRRRTAVLLGVVEVEDLVCVPPRGGGTMQPRSPFRRAPRRC